MDTFIATYDHLNDGTSIAEIFAASSDHLMPSQMCVQETQLDVCESTPLMQSFTSPTQLASTSSITFSVMRIPSSSISPTVALVTSTSELSSFTGQTHTDTNTETPLANEWIW